MKPLTVRAWPEEGARSSSISSLPTSATLSTVAGTPSNVTRSPPPNASAAHDAALHDADGKLLRYTVTVSLPAAVVCCAAGESSSSAGVPLATYTICALTVRWRALIASDAAPPTSPPAGLAEGVRTTSLCEAQSGCVQLVGARGSRLRTSTDPLTPPASMETDTSLSAVAASRCAMVSSSSAAPSELISSGKTSRTAGSGVGETVTLTLAACAHPSTAAKQKCTCRPAPT
mmetsp:Transcript_26062/g.64361  ORF Transcript_26062/g.64361 Transcript_26062/m.64361 type:complete len:231 (+) Transcript_26062:4744-5436(+)